MDPVLLFDFLPKFGPRSMHHAYKPCFAVRFDI